MKRLISAVALLLLTAAAAPAWRWSLPDGVEPPAIPADNPMSAAKIELGRRLFYDADLSADGTMACAACHEQKRAFTDGNRTRPGVHGDPGLRNVPGLANVGWFSRLTIANPALTTLEAQALVPLLGEHPVEMGMKGLETELARRLGADACYRRMFARAFPKRKGRIDIGSVTAALASFQRTMISLDSPYDRFRSGDEGALSPLEQKGARLFESAGCATCHAGAQLSDMGYHRMEEPGATDPGLAEHSGLASDTARFRTPSLRNAALTAPYWHDGSASSLEDAISRHSIAVTATDMPALVAFLQSLTDTGFIHNPTLARPDAACGTPL